MGIYNDLFHYEEVCAYLKDWADIEIKHFYYNRNNPLYPYCYYHRYVFTDMTAFTAEALSTQRVAETIVFERQRLEAVLKDEDYRSFFALIDKRLALYAYQNLFSRFNDAQKFDLFWFIVNRCKMNLRYFPAAFLSEMAALEPKQLPEIESTPTLSVYCGFHTAEQVDFKQAYNWSQNINTAIYHACKTGKPGLVYQGTAHFAHILYAWLERSKREVFILPDKVQDIKKVNLPTYQDILAALDEKKLWHYYFKYLHLLRPSYFHRPHGIHGIGHTKRVLFLCLLIALQLDIPEQELNWLCLCAIFHDIGRENDNWDLVHGINSIKKGQELGLFSALSEKELHLISYIIENHCIDDQYLNQKVNEYHLDTPQKTLALMNIFKDADGLDRIRIFDLDVNRLRHEQAAKLLIVARQLYHKPLFDSFLPHST